jgi:hypothetical protein
VCATDIRKPLHLRAALLQSSSTTSADAGLGTSVEDESSPVDHEGTGLMDVATFKAGEEVEVRDPASGQWLTGRVKAAFFSLKASLAPQVLDTTSNDATNGTIDAEDNDSKVKGKKGGNKGKAVVQIEDDENDTGELDKRQNSIEVRDQHLEQVVQYTVVVKDKGRGPAHHARHHYRTGLPGISFWLARRCDLMQIRIDQGLYDAALDQYTRGMREAQLVGGETVQLQGLGLMHAHLLISSGELDTAVELLRTTVSRSNPSNDDSGSSQLQQEQGLNVTTRVKSLILLADCLQDEAQTLQLGSADAARLQKETLEHLLHAEQLLEHNLTKFSLWRGHLLLEPDVHSNVYLSNIRLVPIVKQRLAKLLANLDATVPALERVCQGLQASQHVLNWDSNTRALLLFCYGRLQRLSNEQPMSATSQAFVENSVAAKTAIQQQEYGLQWVVDEVKLLKCVSRQIKAVTPYAENEDVGSDTGELDKVNSVVTSAYAPFALATETSLEQALATSFLMGGHNHQLMASACMELVLLYGNGPAKGAEAQHRDLACFYLRCAAEIRKKYAIFTVEAHQLGDETISDELLSNVPSATLRDIMLNYQDPGTSVTFRNIIYRLRALRRDQHVSAVLASRNLDEMLGLHRFLFEHYPKYAESCCLPAVPTAADVVNMTLPDSLVSAQWYQGINNENIVDFVFLLGIATPEEDDKIIKGKEVDESSTRAQDPVVWFNKMSLDVNEVHKIHVCLQELDMHFREKRIDEEEAAQRFSVIRDQISVLLVGDVGHDDAQNVSREDITNDDSTLLNVEGRNNPAAQLLPGTLENIRKTVELFDVQVGLDESNSAMCAWLRHILVPQM